MSTGESLIWISIIVFFSFGVYKISKNKKWKTVGKIIGVLLIIILIISGGVYIFNWYKNLPYEIKELGKVSLDMVPVEVTLQLGKPHTDFTDDLGVRRLVYLDYYGNLDYLIKFEKDTSGTEKVTAVCSEDYKNDFFGLGIYDSEDKVIKKLGQPTGTSVNKDGLVKLISYEKWNVAFMIEKGDIKQTCVSKSGKVTFIEEYK